MAIRIALHHRTRYRFDRDVSVSPHVVRLRPAPHCRTSIVSYSLSVEPREHFLNWQQDPQGNHLARIVFPRPARELTLTVDLVADLVAVNAFDFFLEPEAETFPFAYDGWLATELAPFRATTPDRPRAERERLAAADGPRSGVPVGPLVEAFAAEARAAIGPGCRTTDALVAVNRLVADRVKYLVRHEPGVQTPDETLSLGSGSCRDSAWLLVAVLRRLGLAARFCSGYLVQLAPDVRPLDGPPGPSADFTDLHAWTEVFLPGAGWVGLDPTSGLLTAEGHIPLAATPDPASAAPVSGRIDPCDVAFDVTMRLDRVAEEPRTTRPVSADAWDRILGLGRLVDRQLAEDDVRLTAGGEPTFVSVDDFDGPEWNTVALGPEKRAKAGDLARRLLRSLGDGGVLLEVQGKWYPGEPLPRWALEVIWRSDGEPIWRSPRLLAGDPPRPEQDGSRPTAARPSDPDRPDRAVEPGLAGGFCRLLAERLGLDAALVMPAYEDPRRAADLQLGPPVAHVLPLLRAEGVPDGSVVRPWRSSRWPLDADGSAEGTELPAGWRGLLLLVPGDSPAGLRLPMHALPWPDEAEVRAGTAIVRTAIVVEVRQGRLQCFLPPLDTAADWLDLLSVIEGVALELDTPVVLEGYPPPHEPILARLQVTPDPGVIEVNVPPAVNWDELVRIRETLDDEARESRLCAEKFELDGRHSGTGGGDHLVLGGATPADSPFLRRPDLLASMVSYWNNHPSLSYLFAGLFIGPTSQAPRIDEARHESLHELEIAIEQLEAAGPRPLPWFVDRVFRHLLTDLTGNTHRAEFCIDKLYSPDSAAGRRGLVELRAFEMAPHVRMGLLTQLVVRALVAWLWREPAKGRLVRWGTALHDRFLLPTFLLADFDCVLADLARAGFPFDPRWFHAHHAFRFPSLGEVTLDGVRLSLRAALEPWNVLGEEPVGGATARMVDSSLERIEVLVSGLPPDRYAVACNRRRVPLHPTGVEGVYVAGVRYRAWQPPTCLHPTIGVHTPLVFDLVDLWNRRSIGGCTWHVSHPGGRAYETRPVNALESESRRASRFFASGHTPGPMEPPAEEPNPFFPLTLDLRRRPRSP
jgi:uncharacterized protein (DUF2126 family)/transglutaminase-like putative cysteine protease